MVQNWAVKLGSPGFRWYSPIPMSICTQVTWTAFDCCFWFQNCLNLTIFDCLASSAICLSRSYSRRATIFQRASQNFLLFIKPSSTSFLWATQSLGLNFPALLTLMGWLLFLEDLTFWHWPSSELKCISSGILCARYWNSHWMLIFLQFLCAYWYCCMERTNTGELCSWKETVTPFFFFLRFFS